MTASRIQVEHVLCPTDFSEFSERALRHAIAIARSFNARLTVAHALPYIVSGGGWPEAPGPFVATAAMRKQSEQELGRFAQSAVDAGIPVRLELREGDASREIQAVAEELAVDLIVMGTHGRGGFERFLLGSVTEKVLRRAPCPVLTVCHESSPATLPFHRILCAADLSPSSAHTIQFALSMAEESQARLTLLHVIEGLAPGGGALYLSVPEVGPLRQDLARRAHEDLRQLVPGEARAWCEIKELVAVGRAQREILRVAQEEGADVIVMGSHGHGLIGQMVFGSTSHHVVREAQCPVLTVRPVRAAQARPAETEPAAVGAKRGGER